MPIISQIKAQALASKDGGCGSVLKVKVTGLDDCFRFGRRGNGKKEALLPCSCLQNWVKSVFPKYL